MHRKNRRDTGCGLGTQRGVDLNRNYGYGWGANDTGSVPILVAQYIEENRHFQSQKLKSLKTSF